MEYLHTFTIHLCHMWVNMPYMDLIRYMQRIYILPVFSLVFPCHQVELRPAFLRNQDVHLRRKGLVHHECLWGVAKDCPKIVM